MPQEKIRYARSRDGAKIAWIEAGKGAQTLLIAPNAQTNIADNWNDPIRAPMLKALCAQFRVVRFDDRGCGHSSRGVDYSLDKWADDIEAVANDAIGAEPFVLHGVSASYGAMAFAARAPERLSHLLIYGAKANGMRASGISQLIEWEDAQLTQQRLTWGTTDPALLASFFVHLANDLTLEEQRYIRDIEVWKVVDLKDYERQRRAYSEADCRPLLPAIKTPTLVGHSRGDKWADIALGRKIARAIPGAAMIEIESDNHALRERDGSLQAWMSAVTDFVYGARNSINPIAQLSARERDVLDGLCAGLTNDAIAARLGISEKTVRNHLTQVFEKLGVATRTQAVLAAMEARRG